MSLIAACGSGRSTNFIPAVPAACSVTTIAFIITPQWLHVVHARSTVVADVYDSGLLSEVAMSPTAFLFSIFAAWIILLILTAVVQLKKPHQTSFGPAMLLLG